MQVNGEWVAEDGVYHDGTTQVVVNDGQVVANGDVDVRQAASGDQTVTTVVRASSNDWYDGMPAGHCQPGAVIASPHGVLYFQKNDCCWYLVPCIPCKQQCNGDVCPQGK